MEQIQLEARRILRRSPSFYRSHPTYQKTQPNYPGEFHDIAAAVAAVR
jgi:hypothetical protein